MVSNNRNIAVDLLQSLVGWALIFIGIAGVWWGDMNASESNYTYQFGPLSFMASFDYILGVSFVSRSCSTWIRIICFFVWLIVMSLLVAYSVTVSFVSIWVGIVPLVLVIVEIATKPSEAGDDTDKSITNGGSK